MKQIGENLRNLVCLQIRSCEAVTDEGMGEFCEALSGYSQYKLVAANPNVSDHASLSKLQYLNMSNDRVLTDKTISAVAPHLLCALKDLCFVSSHHDINVRNSTDATR